MTEKKTEPKQNLAKDLEHANQQIESLQAKLSSMTHDEMTKAPLKETEPQTKLSQKEIANSSDVYLKPERTTYAVDPKTGKGQVFNEKFRSEYEFKKQYVQFTAENNEIIGETIEVWTRPYGGLPAEFWKVPVNKPVWGPRYLAERLADCKYRRLVMQEKKVRDEDSMATYTGTLEIQETRERITARPVTNEKTLFMGAAGI